MENDKNNFSKAAMILTIINSILFLIGLVAVLYKSYFLSALLILLLSLNFIALRLVQVSVEKSYVDNNMKREDSNNNPAEHELNLKITALTDINEQLSKENTDLSEQLRQASDIVHLFECPIVSDTQVDISKLIEQYISEHKNKLSQKGISSTIHIDEASYLSYISKEALTLICDNLFDNIYKFTPENGYMETIISHIDNEILIILKNSGNGIPAEDIYNVTKMNFQSTNCCGGTGLGLTQTDAIVNACGGKMWIKSAPGLGFAVYLQFPISAH